MFHIFANAQVVAQLEVENSVEPQAREIVSGVQVRACASRVEIDSIADVFGALYRVWYNRKLLGTFYENLSGQWVAQPCNSDIRPVLDTSGQAQSVIIASYLQA